MLDPFAGGGSIPLEAQQLGLEAHASDLNPVAVMINKAQIEIPPRFASMSPVNPRDRAQIGANTWRGAAGLAANVRYYGEWMREKAFEKIGHLYPTHNGETVIAWLWARTVKSPNPAVNAHVPLVRSFILSKKKGRECWAKPIVEGNTVRFEVTAGKPPKDGDGTVVRSGGTDIISGEPIPFTYIREEGKAGRMGAILMAIVTEGQSGRSYYSPDDKQSKIAKNADGGWHPSFDISHWPGRTNVVEYGLTQFGDLFTPRQLVVLTTFSDLVHEARAKAHTDAHAAGLPGDGGRGTLAYAEAVSVYLVFAVSRGSDINNALCRWEISKTQVRNLFGRQAIPMVWDYAESNVFNNAAGDYLTSLESILRVLERTLGHGSIGNVLQVDAQSLDTSAIALSTDPPYYDNVGYADLSDFFYVWLRKSLHDIYPEIFGTILVPKEPELIASPYRHAGKEAANQHFESGMHQAFGNIRRFISHDYPLTVYYAFKQQDSESTDDDDESEKQQAPARAGKPCSPV